jgi:hypothetical protein
MMYESRVCVCVCVCDLLKKKGDTKHTNKQVQMILQMNLSSPVKRKPRETFESSIERIAIDEPGR